MLTAMYSDQLFYMYAEDGYSPNYVQRRTPVLVIYCVRCTEACCPGVYIFAEAITADCPVYMEISCILCRSKSCKFVQC